MKKIIAAALLLLVGCSKVPAGHVGIKVYLLGGSKGVDHEVLGVGRYWVGINEELYLFPTYEQNYTWTHSGKEGSPSDESITFQTTEGLNVNADVGISYHIRAADVAKVFQKYRRGLDEITDVFLRNQVRDAFNSAASSMPVEAVYGEGKTRLLEEVQKIVAEQVDPIGIEITKIYLVGTFRLPETVVAALNAKIEATQRAQQRENELREAEAEAKKKVAEAQGQAESILATAKAQAESNLAVSKSLTPELIEYERIKKWDGKLPVTQLGNATPIINLGKERG